MRNYSRLILPAAGAVILFLGPDLRWASAQPPSAAQDVNVVSPLTNNGSVPVEATIKGIVKTRANPALTHVGALASDVVTLSLDFLGALSEIHSDGSSSTFTAPPAGKALVITDLEWQAFGGTPGDHITFALYVKSSSGVSLRVYMDLDRFDDNGEVSRSRTMTTGIAFGPGTSPVLGFGGVPTTVSVTALAHGYYLDTP